MSTWTLAGVVLSGLLLASPTYGQNAEKGSNSTQTQIDQNASKKSAAEAEKAELDAKAQQIANEKAAEELAQLKRDNSIKNMPKTNVTVPDGSSTINDQGKLVESELLANIAVVEIADAISEDIEGAGIKSVALYRDDDLVAIGTYRAISAQLKVLQASFDEAKEVANSLAAVTYKELTAPPEPDKFTVSAEIPETLSLIQGVAQSAAQIASLFQSKSQLYGIQVQIKQEAVEYALAASLKRRGISVAAPHQFPQGILNLDEEPELVTLLKASDSALDANRLIGALEAHLKQLSAEAEAESDPAKKAAAKQIIADHAVLVKKRAQYLADLDAIAQKLRAALMGGSDKAGIAGTDSPLTALLKAELIARDLKQQSHVLSVSAVSMGGGVLTVQNLWTFFGAPRIYHSGGAALAYVVFEVESGKIAASGDYPLSGGYVRSSQVRKVLKKRLDDRSSSKGKQ